MLVTLRYTKTYADPIRGKMSDALEIDAADGENPDWNWCVGPEGRAGWVHRSIIDRAHSCLNADYDARELDVEAGEEVTVLQTLSSWAWCVNAKGVAGWVPINCLEATFS